MRRPTGYPAAGGDASWPHLSSDPTACIRRRQCLADDLGVFPRRPLGRSCRRTTKRTINLQLSRVGRRALVFILTIMIASTVVFAFWLARRSSPDQVLLDTTPDLPCSFGCGMAWLAVRSRDTQSVLEALGLYETTPCNWNSGIGAVYDHRLSAHVYVTPPVRGWVFVVGLALPYPVGSGFVDKCTPLLVDLGGRFPQVQYFFSCPSIDYYAWARVRDGRLTRAFAVTDEGIVWNKGRTTKEERALGLKLFELRGVEGRKGDAGGEMILHPTEDHVMRLAHGWSIDPTTLETQSKEVGLGHLALAPVNWRAERQRKAA